MEIEAAGVPVLSVVIPVLDEVGSLEQLHGELIEALEFLEGSFEILFVDDGSRDGSVEVLDSLARSDARVRVLAFGSHEGQSAALAAGFGAARGEFTGTLDADLQNDPADFKALMDRVGDADVVNGVRVERHDSWQKVVSSRIANAVRNRLTGDSITDVGCSLRVMRTSFLRRVKLYDGLHRFLPTLLRLEGARVVEVPVAHRPRLHGRSKYGIRNRLFKGIADLVAVRWMIRRHIRTRVREERGRPD